MPEKSKFYVSIGWEMTATVEIEAESLEDAMAGAVATLDPKTGQLLEDTFEVWSVEDEGGQELYQL